MSDASLAKLLAQHPFTEGFWPDHIARMAGMAGEAHFACDELIFQEGDRSSLFYVLISGNVALEVVTPGRPVRVSTLYSGDVLGWSSLVESDAKQFQARALEEVRAIAFDGARLRHACQADYAFGFMLMRALAKVMANRLHAARQQLHDVHSPVAG